MSWSRRIHYAPLSSTFMLASILGFLLSIWLVMDWSEKWGFTLALIFVIMFIASIISMSKAEPIDEHMDHLSIHEPHKAYKRHNR
ncbi:hypothetical protein COV13_02710 [Candidatus Woesearchaeota archaeon CG10_big_fil_rev_8_21_14_0_10_32_9]|nr:MAG: hypothetical protein COV13_02710 [Candidatus Woesearchaeota archaeon CG10_big_fil_rev_8_21_14_0_10_32_9]